MRISSTPSRLVAFTWSARTDAPLSVIVLDLDGFKEFNDRRGHGPGDALLVEAATLWSLQIREMDLIARHGGDEFVVLLPDADLWGAAAVADRLVPSTPREVTVSGGVAEWDGTESPDELLKASLPFFREEVRRFVPAFQAGQSSAGQPSNADKRVLRP